ncbi:MAG: hypothetical protein NZM25_01145 [Leptospiraceae bacterium]|nr:hypothetical protein [Leptospiraceae bacterium]MDW8306330.1 hypothetical protein [Leptospiraceae bacterium]
MEKSVASLCYDYLGLGELNSANASEHMRRCQLLEDLGFAQAEEAWREGLKYFWTDINYWQGLISFLYRNKKYHLVLEYARKMEVVGYLPAVLKMAVQAALALAQKRLAWYFFKKAKFPDIASWDAAILWSLARIALEESFYQEAMQLLELLRAQKGLTPLPDLKTTLVRELGSEEAIINYVEEIQQKLQKCQKLTEVGLMSILLYTSALIYMGRSQEALAVLESYRLEFVSGR